MANVKSHSIDTLLTIMARLRDQDGGCPWDLQQTFKSIAPYTIEEAYEVADAIEREAYGDLKDELGDLIFQVVFHAQIASEARLFEFADIVEAIIDKMTRRHPHVFGTSETRNADEQSNAWEAQKAIERKQKGANGLLDDIPANIPGLTRAVKLQKRAARVGFDWTDWRDVFAKVNEELGELDEAVNQNNTDNMEEEFGDLLFVVANLARHLKIDPETAMRRANQKFIRRFHYIEKGADSQSRPLDDLSIDEMEALWREAKKMEKTSNN